MDELQLLVSEGNSLEVQVGSDDTSSTQGGGGGRREGGGRGGGGGGGRGGGGGGGGAGRHGWKPLHFGPPFVSGTEESDAFRISTLSNDFVLQRFFYRKNTRQEERMIEKTFRGSQDTANNEKPY